MIEFDKMAKYNWDIFQARDRYHKTLNSLFDEYVLKMLENFKIAVMLLVTSIGIYCIDVKYVAIGLNIVMLYPLIKACYYVVKMRDVELLKGAVNLINSAETLNAMNDIMNIRLIESRGNNVDSI